MYPTYPTLGVGRWAESLAGKAGDGVHLLVGFRPNGDLVLLQSAGCVGKDCRAAPGGIKYKAVGEFKAEGGGELI